MKGTKGMHPVKRKICFLIFIGLLVLWICYAFLGNAIIDNAYHDRSFSLLNKAISGSHGVDYYQNLAFGHMKKFTLYTVIFLIILLIPSGFHLSIISIIVLFVLLEGIFILHGKYLDLRYGKDSYGREVLWQHDPLLGWRNTANAEEYQIHQLNRIRALCKTNSLGIRDHEYSLNKPKGTKRILFIGDSGVAGFEVDKEDTIDSKLEVMLRSHGSYEVINAGTRGYGTDQTLLNLKERMYKYNPDLVIYFFFNNDLVNNITVHRPYRKFAKSYFVDDENGNLVLEGVPVPEKYEPFNRWTMSDSRLDEFFNKNLLKLERWQQRKRSKILERKTDLGTLVLADARKLKDVFWKLKFFNWLELQIRKINPLEEKLVSLGVIDLWLPEDPEDLPPFIINYQYDKFQKLLGEMKRFVENDMNADFMMYEWTNTGVRHDQREEPNKRYAISKQLGVHYFNSFDEFREKTNFGKNPKYNWPYDEHWNEAGHKLAAEGVYWHLRDIGWVQ